MKCLIESLNRRMVDDLHDGGRGTVGMVEGEVMAIDPCLGSKRRDTGNKVECPDLS